MFESPLKSIPNVSTSIIGQTWLKMANILRLLPSHECYRNIDGTILDPTELDKAEPHLQYLVVQRESFPFERKDVLENKSVKRSSRIAPFSPFVGPNGLIR